MKSNFEVLKGKTLVSVTGKVGADEMLFTDTNGVSYILHHSQNCCESVTIEDINGDLNDLIGSEILQAEESSNRDPWNGKPEKAYSFTWTFYRIATMKGGVVIRWLGESNGYYSESVDFDITQNGVK